jgi:hypothetical protein
MTKKLFIQAILKFLLGIILVGLLIFIPAGTIHYFNGWLFMELLFIPMFIAGVVMMIKNPTLLKSRLEAKEKQKEQGLLIKLSGLMFIAGFIIAGLDFRNCWTNEPFQIHQYRVTSLRSSEEPHLGVGHGTRHDLFLPSL